MIALDCWRSPIDGSPLRADTAHSVTDGSRRWPVIEDIAYLRTGREALADAALAELDAGNVPRALARLLADRDDWDRTTPPSQSALQALVRNVDAMSFRETMHALAYGDVATYFAHRWSDPTFVAGLGLLAAHRPLDGRRSFEVACGAGHYLRELWRVGVMADGGDVVFSKLWLARRFVVPGARLVCFDAASRWPIASATYDLAHVHDALYFLARKPFVASELQRVMRQSGTLAISHAHNAAVENFSSGDPLDRTGYAALFPGAIAYDDRALADAVVAGRAPVPATTAQLDRAAALAFVAGPDVRLPRACDADVALPAAGTPLVRNPLYAASADRLEWPSQRYENEYAALRTYPHATNAPARATMSADRTVASFARTRELVALPDRW